MTSSPKTISDADLWRRATQEFRPGGVVALDATPYGLPDGIGVWFLDLAGLLCPGGRALPPGSAYVGVGDVASIMRGGYLDVAVRFVGGSFDVHPGFELDLVEANRLVSIARDLGAASGQTGRVDVLITGHGVLRSAGGAMEVVEVAPGWTADDIIALAGGRVSKADGIREMTFDAPDLPWPNKVYPTALEAVHDVPDGAVVNLDGFGGPGGMAHYLMTGLRELGAKGLTVISNTAGIARVVRFGAPEGVTPIDHTILVEQNQIAHSINSYPVSPSASRPSAFEEAYQRGDATLEVVPQGTLAERLRSGGAGVGAFYTPTAAGTLLAEGKETRAIDGKDYVLERAILADFCIMRGHKADTLGNVVYKGTSRNFNPVMATAARVTVVEVDEIVEPGELGPEAIVTPGIFVDRIVRRPDDFSPYL